MPATASQHESSITDSADVRVRVRAAENGSVVPIRAGMNPGFAHARAIPPDDPNAKTPKPSKIRNFVSQHAGEAGEFLTDGWLGSGRPQSLTDVARTTIPTRAEAPNVGLWLGMFTARTFRLAVHTLAYLLCAATGTDKRAAVACALTVLTFTTTLVYATLAGH